MEKHVPERMCVGCREMKSKKELLRVIKTADQIFLIDTGQKANGRGAYLCRNEQCLEAAKKNRGLARAFKSAVPDSFLEEIQAFIRKG